MSLINNRSIVTDTIETFIIPLNTEAFATSNFCPTLINYTLIGGYFIGITFNIPMKNKKPIFIYVQDISTNNEKMDQPQWHINLWANLV